MRGGGGGLGLVYSQGPYRGIRLQIWLLASEAESKEKHGAWDPMPELTITSPYVYSRVDSNTFTMGNPMPESTLSPSLGLWILPLTNTVDVCVR